VFEGRFEISCSQCGGQEFHELFPVPAESYRLYEEGRPPSRPRQLVALVYACQRCGHLEKFVDLDGEAAGGEGAPMA
jgi:uncharacterized Zn finger protein